MLTLTLQEKQNLIDSKDWDGLVKTDFFIDFNYNQNGWENYTFDKELILDFFCNYSRYTDHILVIREGGRGVYADDVWANLSRRINQLNIKMDTTDWVNYLNAVMKYRAGDYLDSAAFGYAVSPNGKGQEYLRVLLDDVMWDKISKIKVASYGSAVAQAGLFDGFTSDEVMKIIPRLSFNGNLRIVYSPSPAWLLKHIDDYDKGLVFARSLKLKPFEIYMDLDADTYKGLMMKEFANENSKYGVSDWYPYFEKHPEVSFDDDMLDDIVQRWAPARVVQNFVYNLTKDQLKKYKNDLAITLIARRKDLSLDEVVELKPEARNVDLGRSRFFTEDEIAKHPQFFDPRELSKYPYLYITPATFKLMNQAWGKRQKYNVGLTDFDVVAGNLTQKSLSADTLDYLRKVCKVSNDRVINVISKLYIPGHFGKEAQKIGKLKDFLKAYGE